MSPRDWTPADAADAADDERDRQWWRHDPYAEPDYRSGPAESGADDGEAVGPSPHRATEDVPKPDPQSVRTTGAGVSGEGEQP